MIISTGSLSAVLSKLLSKRPKNPALVIDLELAALEKLVLIGWTLPRLEISGVIINGINCPFECTRVHREDVLRDQGHRNAGFVMVADVGDTLYKTTEVNLHIDYATGETAGRQIALSDFDPDHIDRVRQESQREHYSDPILKSFLFGHASHARPHLDFAESFVDGGLVVSGWAQDVHSAQLYLTDANRRILKPIAPDAFESRPDVSETLAHDRISFSSHIHGFASFVDLPVTPDSVIPLAQYGSSACFGFETTVVRGASMEEKIVSTLGILGKNGLPEESTLDRIEKAAARTATSAGEPKSVTIFRDHGGSRISNIVPFYGDDFFLIDHIQMQANSPEEMEWVFVCDDPRIASSMHQTLTARRELLRRRTTLVVNESNLGFGRACNVGVQHARGEYLLLTNSDIYIPDYSPILAGIEHLKMHSDAGICGFSLCFEDNTVQHDGMIFETHPTFRDRWVCTHPGKGTPVRWSDSRIEIVEMPAVSGALLLLRRETVVDEDVFSNDFIVGDYEDADLCLRLFARGLKSCLVRGGRMYHLERQSFVDLGSATGRHALSYMNCRILNRKWGESLSTRFAVAE